MPPPIPSPSAICTVNGFVISDVNTSGIDVAPGSTITIALASSAGVNRWFIEASQSDDITQINGNLVAVNNSKIQTGFVATFVVPPMVDAVPLNPHGPHLSRGNSLQFTSTVNGGEPNEHLITFGVFVRNTFNNRLFFGSESFESNATVGNAADLNAMLTSLPYIMGGDLCGLTPDGYIKSISGCPLGTPVNVYTSEFFSLDPLKITAGGSAGAALDLHTGSHFLLSPNELDWTPINSNTLTINAASQALQLPTGTNLIINSGSGSTANAPGGGVSINTGGGFGAGNGGDFNVTTGSGGFSGAFGSMNFSLHNNSFLNASVAGGIVLSSYPLTFNGTTFTINGTGLGVNATAEFFSTTKFYNPVTFEPSASIGWAGGMQPTFNQATVSMPADANYTLSSTQYNFLELVITSAVPLTNTRDLIFPLGGLYTIHNATSGSQAIRIRGTTGAAFTINTGFTAVVWSDGVNFYGTGGNSGVNWANDLAGSTDFSQTVVALSGVGVSGGIDVFSDLTWQNVAASPVIKQGGTGSSSGHTFTIHAQDVNSSSSFVGGYLNLSSGHSQLGPDGYVNLQTGGIDRLVVSPSYITIPAFSTAGVVHNDSSGNLYSGLIIVGSDITPGSNGDVLKTVGGVATWSSGGSVTWAADLTGSTDTNQWVAAISGSAGAGGTVPLNITTLQFASGQTSPALNQASTSSASGQTLTVQAQGATGATHNGGDLYLASGSSGSATAGTVRLRTDSTDRLLVSPTNITITAFGTAGVVHNDSSGNLSSSLIVNADVDAAAAIAYSKLNLTGDIVNADISSSAAIAVSKLAAGTAGQILQSNATPTPTWTTVTQDISLSNTGVATVVGIRTKAVNSTVASAGSAQDGYALTYVFANNDFELLPGSGGGGGGSGVTTVGTIDSQTKSANGLVIVGTSIYAQTADASNPGLVSTGTQTFAGNKTLSGSTTLSALSTGLVHSGSGGALTSSLLVNVDVDAAAAIAYSKLNLSNSIVNADINSSAAIVYSKLNLTGSIVDADVNASAAIAGSKITPNFGSQALTAGQSVLGTTTAANTLAGSWAVTTRSVSGALTIDTTTTDYILLVDTSATRNITFPAPTNGRIIIIKDKTGTCETNNISLLQHGSEKIDGTAATRVLNTNWGYWTFTSDGTDWFQVG